LPDRTACILKYIVVVFWCQFGVADVTTVGTAPTIIFVNSVREFVMQITAFRDIFVANKAVSLIVVPGVTARADTCSCGEQESCVCRDTTRPSEVEIAKSASSGRSRKRLQDYMIEEVAAGSTLVLLRFGVECSRR